MSEHQLNETKPEAYRVTESPSPFAALADELYRERVLRARKMPAAEKILAGQRLFEAACEITLAGIHHQFPEKTQEECRKVLRERLAYRRKRQNLSPRFPVVLN